MTQSLSHIMLGYSGFSICTCAFHCPQRAPNRTSNFLQPNHIIITFTTANCGRGVDVDGGDGGGSSDGGGNGDEGEAQNKTTLF